MAVSCLSRVPRMSPKLDRDALGPETVLALLEVETLPRVPCSFCFSLPRSCLRETKTHTTKKCAKLLRDIKESLHSMKGCDKKAAKGVKEPPEEAGIEEELSELREKVRGLDRINRALLKRLLYNEQSARKRMVTTMLRDDHQSSDDTGEGLAGAGASPSGKGGGGAVKDTQLGKDEAEPGPHPAQEKSTKLKEDRAEQILREAEQWSAQQAELSELMKLCQQSQHGLRAAPASRGARPAHSRPPPDAWTSWELEAQVRKLRHNTHSVHLLTALLENECQILRHRVQLLQELRRQRRGQHREAWGCEPSGPNTQVTFQIRDRLYKDPDSCRKKKARHSRANSCLAKALRRKKGSAIRLS